MIVVTVITKITLFSLTMRNKNNAIFSVFFSFSSSLYCKNFDFFFFFSFIYIAFQGWAAFFAPHGAAASTRTHDVRGINDDGRCDGTPHRTLRAREHSRHPL